MSVLYKHIKNIYKNRIKIYHYTMSTTSKIISPPSQVRGMKELNKSLFTKEIQVPIINLKDVKVSSLLPHLKKYILKMTNFKPVQTIGTETTIFLNPDLITHWCDLHSECQQVLDKHLLSEGNFEIRDQSITYENFTADDVLKSVLPVDHEGMSSFTKVGHIVHVNLREHLLPYKLLIGQVLLEKVSGCRSVVNKVNIIDSTYRNFKMEVIAGVDDPLVKVKENGCQFDFDFSMVYWNSRLSTEHERIVKSINSGDVLFDVFAGVGPFAIPVAKKKAFVYANDLNPESYKWLNHNAKINKINSSYLKTFNKDGAEFILGDLKENLLKHIDTNNIHITMNLPALAVEFLKHLVNLYTENELKEVSNPPIVYVYCFAKGEDYLDITRQLVFKHIGSDISDKIVDIYRVRTVSSLKEMMRVTFKLDAELLINKNTGKRKHENDDSVENDTKKSVVSI